MATRTYYPTKAAWAAAKAKELREEADSLPYVPAANWRGVRRRAMSKRVLLEEARRFEQIASNMEARGL